MERYNSFMPFLLDNVPLAEISRLSNIPYSTLLKWSKRYKEYGLAGLANKERSDKGNHRKINEEVKLLIEGLLLQDHKPSVRSIYRKVIELCRANQWEEPSYSMIYGIAQSINPALLSLAQDGSKGYADKYELLYNRKSTRPNEIWQSDHCLLKIWLIDNDSKYKRPWLTIIMDDYSRTVAGYYLTFDSPCTYNTSLALRQAIWHKYEPYWKICGIPDTFYTDHGSDFKSQHMEQVSADIRMKLIFSIPGKPRGRGIIERFFQTLHQMLICDLPGYSPDGKLHSNKTTMTINNLDTTIKDYIIEKHNQTEHSTVKAIPQDLWEEGAFIPRLPDSLEQLDLLLLTEAKARKVQQDGISFQNYKYMNITLAAYVGEEVVIRYNPRDMAEIRVYYNSEFLCNAVCHELSNQTNELKDIIKARNHHKKMLRAELDKRSSKVDKYFDPVRNKNTKPSVDEEPGQSEVQRETLSKPLKRYKHDD